MKSINLNKNRGFTLIELLVVMAILGLLATIGLVSFRTAQLKGRDARRKHDLEQIQKALEMHFNDKGRYPTLAEGIPAAGSIWEDTAVAGGAVYMRKRPKDPKEIDYCYNSNATGDWHELYAKLENENDPAIAESGCSAGCSCGTRSDYNYKINSANAP